jgi:hypothetical protein
MQGEARDVHELTLALARYDVGASPPTLCRPWLVALHREGARMTVEMSSPRGLKVVRRVSDVQVAAAVVDSWLQEERAPRTPSAPPAALAISEHPAPPTAARDSFSFTVGPTAVVASDRTAWFGGNVGACATAGSFCLGGLLEGAAGRAIEGDPGTTHRQMATVFAIAERPIPVGRFAFVPGAGIGAGVVRVATADAPSTVPGEATGARTITDVDVLATARAAFAIPIAGSVCLDVGASFDLSLEPHTLETDGMGGAYPRDPRFFLRGGVALRVGRP